MASNRDRLQGRVMRPVPVGEGWALVEVVEDWLPAETLEPA
jgi:hypothetical protein